MFKALQRQRSGHQLCISWPPCINRSTSFRPGSSRLRIRPTAHSAQPDGFARLALVSSWIQARLDWSQCCRPQIFKAETRAARPSLTRGLDRGPLCWFLGVQKSFSLPARTSKTRVSYSGLCKVPSDMRAALSSYRKLPSEASNGGEADNIALLSQSG